MLKVLALNRLSSDDQKDISRCVATLTHTSWFCHMSIKGTLTKYCLLERDTSFCMFTYAFVSVSIHCKLCIQASLDIAWQQWELPSCRFCLHAV